jgi:hypothetical protein
MGMNEIVASVPPAPSFLSVGLSLKISFTLDQQKVTYGTTLLGWKEHAWLVCEWPLQLSHAQQISSGTSCTVSYFHDGRLVGCRSEIREVIILPVPLVFVAYPKAVEEMHLRKHLRVPANEPILLMRADQGGISKSVLPADDYRGGLLQDLSESGCSVVLMQRPTWLRPGATVRMEFELPGLGHITNLTGIVKNIDMREGSEMIGIEFRFNKLEYIEYRGWGGSVRQAVEQCISQRYRRSDLLGAR